MNSFWVATFQCQSSQVLHVNKSLLWKSGTKEFEWGYRKGPLSSEAIPTFLTDQVWKIDKNWGHPTGLRTTEDHKHILGATILPEHWNTATEYHYCHPTLEWVLNTSLPFSYSKGKEVIGKALIMCYELDALMSGRIGPGSFRFSSRR